MLVAILAIVGIGCAQPTQLSCPPDEDPCATGCVDLRSSPTDCGTCGHACDVGLTCASGACIPGGPGVCAIDNGGCSFDATCMDINGTAACLCNPGLTGNGLVCAACTACGADQFAANPCSPVMDTACLTCASPCIGDMFEAQPCGATTDRICAVCSACGPSLYAAVPCGPTFDTQCAPCQPGCTACTGPGATCLSCGIGFDLIHGMCIQQMAMCANGIVEFGEGCDDGNPFDGDGCSAGCTVEAGSYCFGEGPSRCRAGGCDFDPATALPLGAGFAIDGVATASAMGVQLTQRGTIHTTGDVTYPMMIEADVIYSASDVTYLGARGDGLRDAAAADEPTDSLRARLSSTSVELVAGTGLLDSTPTPFTPTLGVPYHVRYIDDGAIAAIEWFNLTNPAEGVAIAVPSQFHGSADRAFVGGGDQGGLTVAHIRVCSAPALPVTTGLAARYTAIPSWTAIQDVSGNVSTWQDVSGNGRDLAVDVVNPVFAAGRLAGHAALDFGGAARLATAGFPLTTDVTVFAVIEQKIPAQWGAIAHHGSRDTDW
ncbi:MAG: hypothetical protein NT062_32320 [Proteobacteria bacterium]|nr:hypothetical protein [Pseudomonadota bacterium]